MAHDITQVEDRPVHRPVAEHARPDQPAHKARSGWLVPTGVAAVAAWTVGWLSGVRWAWREMGPTHRRRATGRR